jgi:hypothetical protein
MQIRFDGRIAQLVEQLTLNQRVHGSSPCAPTIENNELRKTSQIFLISCQHYVNGNASKEANLNRTGITRPTEHPGKHGGNRKLKLIGSNIELILKRRKNSFPLLKCGKRAGLTLKIKTFLVADNNKTPPICKE